jgi:beta-lactamase class A
MKQKTDISSGVTLRRRERPGSPARRGIAQSCAAVLAVLIVFGVGMKFPRGEAANGPRGEAAGEGRRSASPGPGPTSAKAMPLSAPSATVTPSSPSRPSTPSAPPSPTATVDPDAVLAEALRAVATSASGHFSLAVFDLGTGKHAVYAPEGHRFATASIVKVNILAALLLRAQDEGRSLTATEHAQAGRMIRASDNTATDTLWRSIGGADGLARANKELGFEDTTPGASGLWGLTATTATDQLRLLRAVTTGESPLTEASRAYVRELMTEVVSGQDWGVSAAADAGASTALKNGWLPRSATGLWVINSIGEIRHDGHRLLVCVVSDDQRSMAAGVDLVESAAIAAADAITSGWTAFGGPGSASAGSVAGGDRVDPGREVEVQTGESAARAVRVHGEREGVVAEGEI